MNHEDDENLEEVIDAYSSEEAIEAAAREKEHDLTPREDIGTLVKDYPAVQREIDLHGMTGSEAMTELENFIGRCLASRILSIRVITGKGAHSPHFKSVLPELTEGRLADLRRRGKVLAFKRDKTGGAFLVYLIA